MPAIGVPTGNEVKHAAFMDHLHSGAMGRQKQSVLRALALATEPLTRHQIGERAGISLSSACGRVSELADLDYLEVSGTRKDPDARSPRQTLRLTEKGKVEAERLVAEDWA